MYWFWHEAAYFSELEWGGGNLEIQKFWTCFLSGVDRDWLTWYPLPLPPPPLCRHVYESSFGLTKFTDFLFSTIPPCKKNGVFIKNPEKIFWNWEKCFLCSVAFGFISREKRDLYCLWRVMQSDPPPIGKFAGRSRSYLKKISILLGFVDLENFWPIGTPPPPPVLD